MLPVVKAVIVTGDGPGGRRRQRKLLEATVHAGHLGRPEEVASFAAGLLLAGPEYLTGAVLPIDGAQTSG